VLASIFVTLEWNSGSKDMAMSDDEADDLEESIEDMSSQEPSDKETAAVSAAPKAITANMHLTETADNASLTLSPNSSDAPQGVGQFRPETQDPQPLPLPQATLKEDDSTTQDVGVLPQFPGGMTAFIQWLDHNLRYPASAQQEKKQGQVTVTFIINKDGSTADIKVSKSSGIPALDFEAVRVLRMMPRWTPGKEKGKPCRTMVAVPVVFKL